MQTMCSQHASRLALEIVRRFRRTREPSAESSWTKRTTLSQPERLGTIGASSWKAENRSHSLAPYVSYHSVPSSDTTTRKVQPTGQRRAKGLSRHTTLRRGAWAYYCAGQLSLRADPAGRLERVIPQFALRRTSTTSSPAHSPSTSSNPTDKLQWALPRRSRTTTRPSRRPT